jgi:tetratricopeptide (TPR) repeat protein
VSEHDADVTDHHALVGTVQMLLDRRRYAQAQGLVADGLRANPDSVELLYLSAFIDWVHDRNDAAEASLAKVFTQDPEHYGARVMLGQLMQEKKRYADAEQVWIAMLRDFPEDADLYGHYGSLMLVTLNVDKARRLALEGLRHDPDHGHCLFVAAISDLIDGRQLGNNERIDALVRAHPEHLRTGHALLVALEDRGDDRQALQIAQQLLRSQPDSPELVELVRHFRRKSHWSMVPLYPMQRWGWTAVLLMWAAMAFGLPLIAPGLPKGATGTITLLWVIYCLYSWFWPSILRRFV